MHLFGYVTWRETQSTNDDNASNPHSFMHIISEYYTIFDEDLFTYIQIKRHE